MPTGHPLGIRFKNLEGIFVQIIVLDETNCTRSEKGLPVPRNLIQNFLAAPTSKVFTILGIFIGKYTTNNYTPLNLSTQFFKAGTIILIENNISYSFVASNWETFLCLCQQKESQQCNKLSIDIKRKKWIQNFDIFSCMFFVISNQHFFNQKQNNISIWLNRYLEGPNFKGPGDCRNIPS